MKLLVCGGAGFIGSNFVRQRIVEHGDAVTVLDKLTYAGPRGEPRRPARPRRLRVRARRDRGRRRRRARRSTASTRSSTSPPRRTSTARSPSPTRSSRTHALGTFVLLEAARERGVRYVQVSTDEVYGSIEEGSFTEQSPLQPSSPYSRHQGRRRPARRLLPPHLRARVADLPRLEQLRAVPVPGEADPADGAQRAARRPAAGLRRRPAGAQLDLRGGLRARHRPRARARRARARPTTSAAPTRRSTSTSCSASSRSRAPRRT